MNKVKIRYNTNATEADQLHWRVLINGNETLASHVEVNTKLWSTKDFIEGVGYKWHLTCESDNIQWQGDKCIIN
jgi:hypothetical protein